MADALPLHAQAVKDRAAELSTELDDWLGKLAHADKRAAAVATMRASVNLHIEIMGQKAAMKLLREMFQHG